ncbi:MAG TPA: nucleotidyltransferase family protein [Gaiellaceae bacterium]|nr:nucleotidyltransferase family protein [Gaiellaceae bacterium]
MAAGYATRLRPLTDTVAKPLLPLAGRPMLDYLYDKLAAVDEVDELHVVTNACFAADFRAWAGRGDRPLSVAVHDDGTSSNEDRLGAVGDIRFVIERAGLEGEDLLIVAGDNLFDFELADLVAFWHSKDGSAIGVHDVGDLVLAKAYSVVELDEDDRVTYLEEKPEEPSSTLAGIAVYLFPAEHVALVSEYLAEGNSPDQPGRFVVWLYPRVPVYGYRFAGAWLDIGNREQLLDADNRMRREQGLPERGAYSPEE